MGSSIIADSTVNKRTGVEFSQWLTMQKKKRSLTKILSRISKLLVPVAFLVHHPHCVPLVRWDTGCIGVDKWLKHNEPRWQAAQLRLQHITSQQNKQTCKAAPESGTPPMTSTTDSYSKFLISLVQLKSYMTKVLTSGNTVTGKTDDSGLQRCKS